MEMASSYVTSTHSYHCRFNSAKVHKMTDNFKRMNELLLTILRWELKEYSDFDMNDCRTLSECDHASRLQVISEKYIYVMTALTLLHSGQWSCWTQPPGPGEQPKRYPRPSQRQRTMNKTQELLYNQRLWMNSTSETGTNLCENSPVAGIVGAPIDSSDGKCLLWAGRVIERLPLFGCRNGSCFKAHHLH